MTQLNFNTIVDDQMDRCRELLVRKGEEYAGQTDRLSAFKKAAAMEGTTSRAALFGMLAKHIVSISDMCMAPGASLDSIEKWNEKITDSINYLLLLKAVVEEENHNE